MEIGNFTPDLIEYMHVGISDMIKPGEVKEVPDATGKHVLNKFDRRGLVQVKFSDASNMEALKAKSMARWTEFWEDQITRFNQHNEDQKEKGNRYVKPPESLKKRAKMFGIEILQPWRIERKESPELARVERENKDLKDKLTELTKQMEGLAKAVKAVQPVQIVEATGGIAKTEDTVKVNRKRYISLTADTCKGFVVNRVDDIRNWPEINRQELREKWEGFYDEPFPD